MKSLILMLLILFGAYAIFDTVNALIAYKACSSQGSKYQRETNYSYWDDTCYVRLENGREIPFKIVVDQMGNPVN